MSGTEEPAAKEQQKETRNRVIPGYVYVSALNSPLNSSRWYRACACTLDIDGRIKISSDPPATTVDMTTTTVVVGPARFPESSDIYFRRPQTLVTFADCSASSPLSYIFVSV